MCAPNSLPDDGALRRIRATVRYINRGHNTVGERKRSGAIRETIEDKNRRT